MQENYLNKEEIKVGITEFITSGITIQAITKYLFSDFIVNQIDQNQKLVALKEKPQKYQEIKQEDYNFEINEEFRKDIVQHLGQQASLSLQKLYEQLDCGQKISGWQFTITKELNKDQRLKIHNFVREKLYMIESTTIQSGKLRLKFNRNMRKMNPNTRQKYVHFKLYKHGIDTFNAIFRLSKITGISNKIFSTAGLKDKRGHTTQMVSVYNSSVQTLSKFYKQKDRNRQMWIAEFQQMKDDKIQVGGLFGNQFGLILRLLNQYDEHIIYDRLKNIKQIGMINYFGLQRFGQFSIKTYQLGAMVLRKEWKQLIQSILLSDCGQFNVNVLKKELYQTKEYHKAERLLHNRYKIEKIIFKGLSKQGENFPNVFQLLPRSIKSLYTHSLQSYIWNRIVSRRIKQYGLKLVQNDVVGYKKNNKNQQPIRAQDQQQQQDLLQEQLMQKQVADQQQIEIQLINEENIGNYTIHDLVAPLYGPNALVPEQSILFQYITDELELLHLNLQDFTVNSKLYCFKGQFRKMIILPKNVTYKLIKHKNPKDELLSPFYMLNQQINYQEGDLNALQIILQLPKSSYATMAIRQILHISSQFSNQMDLNREYEAKFVKKQNYQQNKEDKIIQ